MRLCRRLECSAICSRPSYQYSLKHCWCLHIKNAQWEKYKLLLQRRLATVFLKATIEMHPIWLPWSCFTAFLSVFGMCFQLIEHDSATNRALLQKILLSLWVNPRCNFVEDFISALSTCDRINHQRRMLIPAVNTGQSASLICLLRNENNGHASLVRKHMWSSSCHTFHQLFTRISPHPLTGLTYLAECIYPCRGIAAECENKTSQQPSTVGIRSWSCSNNWC